MLELVPYKDMTVDPNNPQDIAEKVIKILNDDKLREKMINDGLNYSSKFTWGNTANNLKIYITSLLNN